MKTLLKTLLLVLLSVTVLAADNPVATTAPKAPVKKKTYELPKTGLNQARPKDGWINVEAVGTRLVVKFFDKEKKPAPPDVQRGFAQFRYASKNSSRAPLHREGEALVSTATVRPPHNFLVLLSLFPGEGSEAAESYTFKYP